MTFRPLNVLVAFECSGAVRRAFRALGHSAFSCDLKPATDGSKTGVTHIQMDAISAIHAGRPTDGAKWDLVIAHPPCTRLCNSGVLRLYIGSKKINGIDRAKFDEMRGAAGLFRQVIEAVECPLCVENPVMHGHARKLIGFGAMERQQIQPNWFGDDASKGTVLWLSGLPRLQWSMETYCYPRYVCPQCGKTIRYPDSEAWRLPNGHVSCPVCTPQKMLPRWANQTDSGQNRLPPSASRAAERAVTYPGIAKAMAEQFSAYLLNK